MQIDFTVDSDIPSSQYGKNTKRNVVFNVNVYHIFHQTSVAHDSFIGTSFHSGHIIFVGLIKLLVFRRSPVMNNEGPEGCNGRNKIKSGRSVMLPVCDLCGALLEGLSCCATPDDPALFVFCSRTCRIYYFVRVRTDVEETDLRVQFNSPLKELE